MLEQMKEQYLHAARLIAVETPLKEVSVATRLPLDHLQRLINLPNFKQLIADNT